MANTHIYFDSDGEQIPNPTTISVAPSKKSSLEKETEMETDDVSDDSSYTDEDEGCGSDTSDASDTSEDDDETDNRSNLEKIIDQVFCEEQKKIRKQPLPSQPYGSQDFETS